jgi:hypothetical protein
MQSSRVVLCLMLAVAAAICSMVPFWPGTIMDVLVLFTLIGDAIVTNLNIIAKKN